MSSVLTRQKEHFSLFHFVILYNFNKLLSYLLHCMLIRLGWPFDGIWDYELNKFGSSIYLGNAGNYDLKNWYQLIYRYGIFWRLYLCILRNANSAMYLPGSRLKLSFENDRYNIYREFFESPPNEANQNLKHKLPLSTYRHLEAVSREFGLVYWRNI